MALGLIEDTTLTGIADAIRAKTGKSDLIPTSQMSSEIASIPEPSPPPVVQELNITENGTYEAPEGVDGYNPVIVNVSGGEPDPPDDGKTRLYITVPANSEPELPPPRNQVPLYIQQSVANGVTIDWGDGSEPETLPGTGNVNTTHTYEVAGNYVISLDPGDACSLGLGHETGSCVLGSSAFYNRVYISMLKKAIIGKNFDSSKTDSFNNCSKLQTVIVKSPIQFIPRYFCNSSGVSTIYIPEGIETIGWNAFNSCYNIASFVIPSSVKTIELRAFYTCFGVKHFYIKPITPPNLSDSNAFYNTPSDCIFHVRPESLEAYKAATNWTAYANRMVGDYVD